MTQFRSVEGRKTLVLFSEGFYDQSMSRDLQDVAAAAAASYCVFYTMDLNRRLADLTRRRRIDHGIETEMQMRTAPLAGLAAETDGVYINDATSHMDAALDARCQPVAGLLHRRVPAERRGAWRSADRTGTCRCASRVPARTSARGRATRCRRTRARVDRKDAIDAALAAPFSQQALKVAYTTYVLRSETTGHPRVVLALGADLPLKDEQHDHRRCRVRRARRAGRTCRRERHRYDAAARYGDAGQYLGHSTYRVQFDVPPGDYLMRAVVREPGGLLGSADRRIRGARRRGTGCCRERSRARVRRRLSARACAGL